MSENQSVQNMNGLEQLGPEYGVGDNFKRLFEILTHVPSYVEAIKHLPQIIKEGTATGITQEPLYIPTMEERFLEGLEGFMGKARNKPEELAMDFMPGAMGITTQQAIHGIGRGWLQSLRAAMNRIGLQKYFGGLPSKDLVHERIESLLLQEGNGVLRNYRALRSLKDSLQKMPGETFFEPVLRTSGKLEHPAHPDWAGVFFPSSRAIEVFSKPILKYTHEPSMRAASTTLHEAVHANQKVRPEFKSALTQIEPVAQDWRYNFRGFPGGTNKEYITNPSELMARGVANSALKRLYPDAAPKELYGIGTWYPGESWPAELNPLWEQLTDILLKGQ